jgi:hypothetical protein
MVIIPGNSIQRGDQGVVGETQLKYKVSAKCKIIGAMDINKT